MAKCFMWSLIVYTLKIIDSKGMNWSLAIVPIETLNKVLHNEGMVLHKSITTTAVPSSSDF